MKKFITIALFLIAGSITATSYADPSNIYSGTTSVSGVTLSLGNTNNGSSVFNTGSGTPTLPIT